MKISTNLMAGGMGPGLHQGDILEIDTDEKCTYIALEIMTDFKLLWHMYKGSPIVIDQEDDTTVAKVRLQRYNMDITGKHLLKVIAYGETEKQTDEQDIQFYIYPQDYPLTTPQPETT